MLIKTDELLCEWLRENSSGSYRPSAQAADRLEETLRMIDELNSELRNLKQKVKNSHRVSSQEIDRILQGR